MTSQAILNAEIDSQFPDNNQNLITPAIYRPVLKDMVAFTQQALQNFTTIAVGSFDPPVLPDGTDQSDNMQEAIDSLGPTGGTLQFGVGTYIFNSGFVLPPNVVLRGAGIDATILKTGVDDVGIIYRWNTPSNDTGISGIDNMTLWGFQDRNNSQGGDKLVDMGPFNYYWVRNVKIVYSRLMGLSAIGTVGVVDNCIINQCLRDGINLTGTTYTYVTNNDISQIGDDAIAISVAALTSGVQDSSICVTGNRIAKANGIKCLGARNTVIQNNTLRFYTGYGIFIGIDESFGEGLITQFSISITGNAMLDGLNANTFGGGNIGSGIFLLSSQSLGTGGTAITQYVGEYDVLGQFVQTPDAFINKAGTAEPRGPDGNISITNNTIRQTLTGMTNFSDAGFGLLWYNNGPVNPVIDTLIGEISGITLNTDLENAVIANNTMHGVRYGMVFNSNLNNVSINHNTFFRYTHNGLDLNSADNQNGSLIIDSNLFDSDPYIEDSQRTVPIDGTWAVTDGSTRMGIWYNKYYGASITRNRFRNCIRAIKYVSGNYINEKNIIEFGNGGIQSFNGVSGSGDIFWYYDTNPTSGTFGEYDANFTLDSSSIPTAGVFIKGAFVRNSNPSIDVNNMVILGWIRLTDGSGHVSGTDWAVARASHVSPAA